MSAFGARLQRAVAERGPLCVGIDPHPALLRDWGLGQDVEGLRTFSLTALEAVAEVAACVKPQIAFYEPFGSAGIAVLEELLARARELGVLSVLDAKRGDIGSTMAGYARAFLTPQAPLSADALTLSPFLGAGSLQPAVDLAREHGRGLFVLALTSNPEGASVQHCADAEGRTVAAAVTAQVAQWNAQDLADAPEGTWGSFGLVVGATVGDAPARLGIDLASVRGPLLSPGVGAQGAGGAELAQVFGAARDTVVASSSRGVLRAGPGPEDLRAAAVAAAQEAREALLTEART